MQQGAGTDPVSPYPVQHDLSSAPGRIIVKYRNAASDYAMNQVSSMQDSISREFGASIIPRPDPVLSAGFQILEVPGQSVDSVLSAYKKSSLIEYVEPDFRISLEPSETGISIITPLSAGSSSAIPNDPEYSKLWGLHNTGQSPFNGTPGADISAEETWQHATGSKEIIVAVIDSGVDYTHEDLKDNIWKNEGEIPDNQIDDDGNGYTDDIYGWNFEGNNNSVLDGNGHGTHCSGIIGAVGNNNLGVTGVNWKVRIMPLKFMDSTGNGYVSDAVSAILYANRMGADVISCSWSGTENSNTLLDAISASSAVVVCAAGNSGSDDDKTPVYPANCNSPNIIAVAATDASDNLAAFSNFGKDSVDIAAPGVEIASTYPGNLYAYMSGTSMAAPFISGAAALVKSANPSLTSTKIRSTLLSSADPLVSLQGKVLSQGRLNVYRAISPGGEGSEVQIPSPALEPVLTVTSTATNQVFTRYDASPLSGTLRPPVRVISAGYQPGGSPVLSP
jgi:subtilisin family serine protease